MSEGLPAAGEVVHVRHRQYLVERVAADAPGAAVDLICLDDDAQGKRSRVLWDLELGARILRPEDTGLGPVTRLDEPRYFAAYLHALKWNCVTATDARLFQAPFRAGIKPIFPGAAYVVALVERFVQHCHMLDIEGES